MLCGGTFPQSLFGITAGFKNSKLPKVCLSCTHAFLDAAALGKQPEVVEHFLDIAECLDDEFGDSLTPDVVQDLLKGGAKKSAPASVSVTNPQLTLGLEGEATGTEGLLTRETLGTPREIFDFLGQYCYGQEEARKTLAVAVHNHYKRILQEREGGESASANGVELTKSNVLMIGPSGSGKTLLAQALARRLKVPFAISDATTLTEAGYVGEDVENILLRLVQAADYDLKKAEIGIVYVDEIDKIARKTQNVSITRDVSGEGVQQALLKILENTIANIPPKGGRKHPDQEYLHLNTKNILFICGGAFVGLDKIVARRGGSRQLGFGAEEANAANHDALDITENPLDHVEPEDLVQFGLIPEFVGRLPIITALKELTKEDLVHILTEPKNALTRQFQELMRISGVDLEFTADALEAVAERTTTLHTGARGLRAIIEKRMRDVMFDIPTLEKGQTAKCVIDGAVIRGEKAAVIDIQKN